MDSEIWVQGHLGAKMYVGMNQRVPTSPQYILEGQIFADECPGICSVGSTDDLLCDFLIIPARPATAISTKISRLISYAILTHSTLRGAGALTALSGVIVLAMPTTVIGTNFSDTYEEYQFRKQMRKEDAVSLDFAQTFSTSCCFEPRSWMFDCKRLRR